MANIPLQSISFPGLSDKYTTPVVDNTLTQTGAAADAKKTGDEIAELKNDLSELEHTYSAFVVETETGAIASFTDGADGVPVKDLAVAIEPVQSGSGDPSPDNVRPISGWTGANVTRTGKNLLPKLSATTTTTNGITFTVLDDGTINVNGTSTGVASIDILTNTKNDLSGLLLSGTPQGYNASNCALAVQYWNGGAFSTSVFQTNGTDLTIEESDNIYILLRVASGVTINNVVFRPMARLATEADTSYEPYQGETYEVDWTTEAGTVYGGTLDVTTGVLTVDRAYKLLDGVDDSVVSYRNNGQGAITTRAYVTIANKAFGTTGLISSEFRLTSDDDIVGKMVGRPASNGVEFYLDISVPDTIDGVKAWFANNPAQVVYELATPQTYQLTPEEVSTILGQNNIFADTGNVTVQYRADTKLYIDKVLSA